jgi:PHD/YefM family antitoxin component YafN of YafNO toxin-antitoxin module
MVTPIQNDISFLTNSAGEKTAVLIPIAEYEELMEDLHDLALVAERRVELTIPHEKVLEVL